MPRIDEALAAVDDALAPRPIVDTDRLTRALATLCTARDACTEPDARERISLLVTLVMGIKHPLGEPPWDALIDARRQFPQSDADGV